MTSELETKTFSIADAAKGQAYAKSKFSFYTDYEAVQEFLDLDVQLNTARAFNEDFTALEKLQQDVAERVAASKVTIHLTGVSRRVRRQSFAAAQGQGSTEAERVALFNQKHITTSIVCIENAQGQIDNTDWNVEDPTWLEDLSDADYKGLIEAIESLNMDSARFDRLVDIDFLSKS